MKKEHSIKHPNIHNRIISIRLICLFIIVFTFFLFNSCQKAVKPKCKDCLILHASLDAEVIDWEKFLDKIELIPLETTDNSLISYIEKYDYFEGKHYIFDGSQYILFIFDENGNYLNRIAKKGQGPGEYRFIYDCAINPQKGQIEMLSPDRFIYCYDFNGIHKKTYDLTSVNPFGIQQFQILDDEEYIIWAPPYDGEDGLHVISQETGKSLNSFWQDIYIINSWSSNVFYKFNNEVYFSLPLYNAVYKVKKEGLEEAYEWYFGEKTMDIKRHKISTGMYNYNRDVEVLVDKLERGVILYDCRRNYQNKKYYYVQLRFRFETQINKSLFYEKKTGKNFFFETHGTSPFLYFQDDYMIGVLNYKNIDKFLNCPLIDEENRQKLLSFKEEDNPYLIKYYFKDNE